MAFKTLFFLLFFATSYSQYIFKDTIERDEISLHPYTTIADVGQQKLAIDFVKNNFNTLHSVALKTENDDLGFTQNNFWTQTQLENQTNKQLIYYLETARPMTDVVELYELNNHNIVLKKQVSGDNIPYSERSFDNRKTIFKIEIAPKSKLKLFLHLKSDGEVVKIPLKLYSADSFIKQSSKEQLIFGLFYGILIVAAIIYFFFYFALNEKIFLYYSLYVVFVGLLQFALDGFFFQFLAPDAGWFSNHAVLLIAIIAVFLTGKYSEEYLRIKEYNKKIYSVIKGAYFLLFLLLLIAIFMPRALLFSYVLVNVFSLLFLILIVYTIVYFYWKKIPVDTYFSVGILFLIVGFGIFILYNFGLIPLTFFTQNSSKLGTGLEVIFLSLSMANLIRNLKNEKNELNRLALARSEEMNDLKSYFLSNISHELRTPLNAIMNLTDAISNKTENKKIKKKCVVIKDSSHSLLSSVNDILDFSKIEKGELRLEEVVFNPVTILKSLKNNVEKNAKSKGLEFQFSKSDAIPESIIGDPSRFAQVVNNVLNNAVKFTFKGIVKFDVDCVIKPNDRVSLILKVSDTGIGISKDKMDSIFDSFSQHNIDNKRKFGGLGLGLYVVKTLVDMQKGTVLMDSKLDIGTTCTITIDFDSVPQQENLIVVAEPNVYDLEGKSILVVEDNPMNQMVIKMITKKWLNTTLTYANNGQEGLDALKANQFDIVLMDLQMPVMDGYEATIAIRKGEAGEQNRTIPIIAVTADVMESTKSTVLEIGMNHYLSKPIQNEILYEVVKKWVVKA
ncbi:hybrid sensor histidine kinase/response regulator [Flavobacterium eburneipallidum]|uniref:hybrid sensor histidine kinase/response regulator n=1 Tax=Flavobacterium eburneipallidum TaxID=3003263 RepID=UPI0024827B4E|nr:hybrid sensor histidine kinase/response regulator [Flavobacterium eburneipallidum]